MQCGQVSPFWIKLGTVKWEGAPQRETLYMIEYRRCKVEATEHYGLSHLCKEHAAE